MQAPWPLPAKRGGQGQKLGNNSVLIVLQFGDMRGFWGIWHAGLSQLRKKTGITPEYEGSGTANTALVYHANKLMSLHEGDLPYAVCFLSPASLADGRVEIGESWEVLQLQT